MIMLIGLDSIVQYFKQKKIRKSSVPALVLRAFNESSLLIPKGLYFDKTHTWTFIEKNGIVKMGIDDFLVHITGPLNRVIMKNPGEKIEKGEAALSILQNGKKLTINAPISGTIKSINKLLTGDPSIINSSPFNDGWIYSIEPSGWLKDTRFMIMADTYREWLKSEFSRVKDFFATYGQTNNSEFVPITLQDGGELKENLLADCGPEAWEDFQTKFINTSSYINLVLNSDHKFMD